MKLARLIFRSRRHLLVGPGSMRNSTLQQGSVLKLVRENGFQEIQIRKCNSLFLQGGLLVTKPEASSNSRDKASGCEMKSPYRLAKF
jgi:hypothetical protein